MSSFTQSQLLSSFDISRIVSGDQSGLILSCSDSIYSNHQMTKHNYYHSRSRGCPECHQPLSQQEKKILKLKLHSTSTLPTAADRQFSVRASGTEADVETDSEALIASENTVECPVCKESYNNEANRIVVLPCGHIFCFQCIQHQSFQNKCFICRQHFSEDCESYLDSPLETNSFEAISRRSFEGYPGYPLSCPQIIYSTNPNTAIALQQESGSVSYTRKQIWMFSNGEALLVELKPQGEKVKVLHRWENIPLAFSQSILQSTLASRQTSISTRAISQESYEVDISTNVMDDDGDDLQPPMPVPLGGGPNLYQEFVPIQHGTFSFASPRATIDIQRSQQQLADVIEVKDQWLVGHVLDPRGLIPSDTELSIARNSPCVFRNTFRNAGGFYDYQKLFICINELGVITKWRVHNFALYVGKTEDNRECNPVLGRHSGDSHPYRSDSSLLVHEVYHSTVEEPSQIKNHPLKTFAEVALEYGPQGLGYTHAVDIGSGWPHRKLLCQLTGCQPTLLLYTCDENGSPVGYTLSPYLHLQSESVILGIVSLTTNIENRCNYLTLGVPSSGVASSEISDIQPIITTLSRLIVSRKEQIDSI